MAEATRMERKGYIKKYLGKISHKTRCHPVVDADPLQDSGFGNEIQWENGLDGEWVKSNDHK